MELAGIDPVFVKAVDVLATFSADDYNRMLYEARLKECELSRKKCIVS